MFGKYGQAVFVAIAAFLAASYFLGSPPPATEEKALFLYNEYIWVAYGGVTAGALAFGMLGASCPIPLPLLSSLALGGHSAFERVVAGQTVYTVWLIIEAALAAMVFIGICRWTSREATQEIPLPEEQSA